MYPSFEIAIPGEDASHNQIPIVYCCLYLRIQRSGVSYASGASVANYAESQRVQVIGKTRCIIVLGNNSAARSQAGLNPRLDL